MMPTIEQVPAGWGPERSRRRNVTCIFCGLATPIPESVFSFRGYGRGVSIVRCRVCRKEAPYLYRDILESGDI